MNICVLDTETAGGFDKPFCYNIGLVIADTETGEVLAKREWIVEQVWHNLPLFATAYYADKRQLYVGRMRNRSIIMDKWGYIMQRIYRLFKEYGVVGCYAYNSPFDEKVVNFNCDWFKTQNPFETIPIYDIRGYVHSGLCWAQDFKDFCEKNNCFTDSGNYSTTAETVYQFINNDIDFKEEHTALADSIIEWDILKTCVSWYQLEWNKVYKVYQTVPRVMTKTLSVIKGDDVFNFDYQKIRINKDKTKIILK